ncbi:hypothetical protein [Microcoleus sp. bin38.metabat.b11b12b14.051]|nr:hypothetical protein [Microcoleus sp. bin38.metabat.b11b12b14.051]
MHGAEVKTNTADIPTVDRAVIDFLLLTSTAQHIVSLKVLQNTAHIN